METGRRVTQRWTEGPAETARPHFTDSSTVVAAQRCRRLPAALPPGSPPQQSNARAAARRLCAPLPAAAAGAACPLRCLRQPLRTPAWHAAVPAAARSAPPANRGCQVRRRCQDALCAVLTPTPLKAGAGAAWPPHAAAAAPALPAAVAPFAAAGLAVPRGQRLLVGQAQVLHGAPYSHPWPQASRCLRAHRQPTQGAAVQAPHRRLRRQCLPRLPRPQGLPAGQRASALRRRCRLLLLPVSRGRPAPPGAPRIHRHPLPPPHHPGAACWAWAVRRRRQRRRRSPALLLPERSGCCCRAAAPRNAQKTRPPGLSEGGGGTGDACCGVSSGGQQQHLSCTHLDWHLPAPCKAKMLSQSMLENASPRPAMPVPISPQHHSRRTWKLGQISEQPGLLGVGIKREV